MYQFPSDFDNSQFWRYIPGQKEFLDRFFVSFVKTPWSPKGSMYRHYNYTNISYRDPEHCFFPHYFFLFFEFIIHNITFYGLCVNPGI